MQSDTAGDPMNGLKWTRRTTGKIALALCKAGIEVTRNTVGRLLKGLGFSLRVNHKKLSGGSGPERDEQFLHIASVRQRFASAGNPIVSVDTKKKELVANFKNPGKVWTRSPILVRDHDFPSDALGDAIPYGIYDVLANRGSVFIGTSCNTPAFAVDCLVRWWRNEGRKRYPNSRRLLVLADNGGSNGSRRRAWKVELQTKLCDRHGLTVTVCHYPPGTSKWNPIEHRLFSEISKNWAGRPLDSYDTMLRYIRSTRTRGGLKVTARLLDRPYAKKVQISDEQMSQLRIRMHKTLPKWNYTLAPRNNGK